MKDIGSAARALILSNAEIAELVGPRVYSDQMPQGGTVPAIVYEVSSEQANDVLAGPLGMEEATITVDAYGATRTDANKLNHLIKKHLAGFRGTVSGVTIRVVYQDSGLYYGTDLPPGGSDAHRYITSQDFGFVYGSLEASC